jgi:predicted Zn-dependent peptidase
MLSLSFTDKSLEVQRQVVIEEFKQRYLNQPYGDDWLLLRPLAYKKHPYKWATIGKEVSHIENAKMDDVRAFFKRFYNPSNAILCVAGNFELEYVKNRVSHWFGAIPSGKKPPRILPMEPKQIEFRELEVERKVPTNAFYYAFKMSERKNEKYYVADVLSDALGREKSGHLNLKLKKEKQLVSDITAYITGSLDDGLFVITGKLNDGVSFEEFDQTFWKFMEEVRTTEIDDNELDRLKIKIRTAREFQEQGLLNRAMNLCFFELLGDANGVNEEHLIYQSITPNALRLVAEEILQKENCSLLKIKSIKDA